MKVIVIYNPHSAIEMAKLERARADMLANHIIEIAAYDFQDVRDRYPVSSTPAIIPIRDDLQGENLLDEVEGGMLRMTAEILKMMQEEDLNLHQMETNRIDHLIHAEVTRRLEAAAAAVPEKKTSKTKDQPATT